MYKDVVVKYVHAAWCGNCRAFEPIVKDVISETGAQYKDIDADKEMELCEKKGIMGLPVTFVCKGEKEVRIDGIVGKEKLLDIIKQM